MSNLQALVKPKGANERYQFFKNRDTGNRWKALVELRYAEPPRIDGLADPSPTTLAVAVTVSPIEDSGSALRDDDHRPIVIESWTHTFTPVEMEAEDFDPQRRVMDIVAERIDVGEAKLKGNEQVKKLVSSWGGKAKLKL